MYFISVFTLDFTLLHIKAYNFYSTTFDICKHLTFNTYSKYIRILLKK